MTGPEPRVTDPEPRVTDPEPRVTDPKPRARPVESKKRDLSCSGPPMRQMIKPLKLGQTVPITGKPHSLRVPFKRLQPLPLKPHPPRTDHAATISVIGV
jgi:hypothetical protein